MDLQAQDDGRGESSEMAEPEDHSAEYSNLGAGAPSGSIEAAVNPDWERWMDMALEEAERAKATDEVPIGAVLVWEGRLLARAHNRTRALCDPTAHAEMLVLRRGAREVGAQRLPGAELFTTVEPCFMCAGACSHARLKRVVWAVRDPKFGGAASLGQVFSDERLNHQVEFAEGVRAEAARELLQLFFRSKRAKRS